MQCGGTSPPNKKLRLDDDFWPLSFSEGDVANICENIGIKSQLNLVKLELDSLDDSEIFESHTRNRHLRPLGINLGAVNCLASGDASYASVKENAPQPSPNVQFSLYVPIPSCVSGASRTLECGPIISKVDCSGCPRIAEDARRETAVLSQISHLRQKGLWSADRLPKVMEPRFGDTLHNHVLNEMIWLSVDFLEERRWKREMARKLALAAQAYLSARREWNRWCERIEAQLRIRLAHRVSVMVKEWWNSIERDVLLADVLSNQNRWHSLFKRNKDEVVRCTDICSRDLIDIVDWKPELPSPLTSTKPQETIGSEFMFPANHASNNYSVDGDCSTSSSRVASFVYDDDHFGITELLTSDASDAGSIQDSLDSHEFPEAFCSPSFTVADDKLSESEKESEQCSSFDNDVSLDNNLLNLQPPCEVKLESVEAQTIDEDVEMSVTDASSRGAKHGSNHSCPTEKNTNSVPETLDSPPLDADEGIYPDLVSPKRMKSLLSQYGREELFILKREAKMDIENVLPSGYFDPVDTDAAPIDAPTSMSRITSDPSIGLTTNTTLRMPTINSLTCSPWSQMNYLRTRLPNEVRSASLALAPLSKSLRTRNDSTNDGLLATAYGSTFAVRSLPSPVIGGAVTWLRHAYSQGVPGLILSPNSISGDAELVVAAHLGQLCLAPPQCQNVFPETYSSKPEIIGDWGPHLIVTTSLCIPSWRSRLLTWCPGLRITCMGLGARKSDSSFEPSGTGRRLRSSVARGAVNICITSYAALRARPSRYWRIRWSVIVFDQVQQFLRSGNAGLDVSHRTQHGAFDYRGQATNSDCNLTNTGRRRSDRVSPCLLETLTSELHYTGHRILISSSSDVISTECGYRLFELSKLLLLNDPVDSSMYQVWLDNLFSHALAIRTAQPDRICQRLRPSKKQLIKFLDPFVVRLDEFDDWETCVSDETVYCPMTHLQCQLHDATLSTKAAQNAMKTGNLLDLLQTVSSALRICNHPCLSDSRLRVSHSFQRILQKLNTDQQPIPGPFVFRMPLCGSDVDVHVDRSPGLLYDTPKAVVTAVDQLRHSELSDITLDGFSLAGSLSQPSNIRSRIAELAPNMTELDAIVSSRHASYLSLNSSAHVANSATKVDRSDRKCMYNYLSIKQPIVVSDSVKVIPPPIMNGLPESNSVINPASHRIDFSRIPASIKRLRSLAEAIAPVPEVKRPRIDDVRTRNDTSDKPYDYLDKRPNISGDKFALPVCNQPFLNENLLAQLEQEMNRKFSSISNLRSSRLSSHTNSNTPSRTRPSAVSRGKVVCASSLAYINDRRCKQFVGLSDWCSSGTCDLLDFNANSSLSRSKGISDYLRSQSRQELSIWNVVPEYISILFAISLLCTRSSVIAPPPRITSQSSFRFRSSRFAQSSSVFSSSTYPILSPDRPLAFDNPFFLLYHYLSWISYSLYPFSERSRWLACTSAHSVSFNRSCSHDSDSLSLNRCMFRESGKLVALYELLQKLIQSPPTSFKNQCNRLRCIYFVAHQAVFLDIIEAFLSSSVWRYFTRIRIPTGHNALGVSVGHLIDRINHMYANGYIHPIFVLVHARSPSSHLVNLRVGPDSCVIVCDTDWRSDVADHVRALMHSWMLNGLGDSPYPSVGSKLCYPLMHIYRLVSTSNASTSPLCQSVELSLSPGIACLLPDAVFQAHSIDHTDHQAILSSRVQPNIVNELLASRASDRMTRHFGLTCRESKYMLPGERLESSIKQEAPSYSSTSSIASSLSYFAGGEHRDADDEGSTDFRQRELLGTQLITRAFELFEDPVDVQAWRCFEAENTAAMQDFCCDNQLPVELSSDDIGPVLPECQQWCETKANVCLTAFETCLGYPSGFDTGAMLWEVGYNELTNHLAAIEPFSDPNDRAPSCWYDNPPESTGIADLPSFDKIMLDMDGGIETDACISPVPFSDLIVWNPLPSLAFQQSVCTRKTARAVTHDQPSWDDSDWGYESEPMSERELPPVFIPTTAPTPPVSCSTMHKRTSLTHPIRSTLNRTLNSSGSLAGISRAPLSGCGMKRRNLTAASILPSKKSTVHPILPISSALEETHELTENLSESETRISSSPIPLSTGCRLVSRDLSTISVSGTSSSSASASGTFGGTVLTTSHSVNVVLLNAHPTATGVGPKMHIPRSGYNKDVISSRANRARRTNVGPVCSSNAVATGVTLMAQSPVSKTHLYPNTMSGVTSIGGNISTSALLTRYGYGLPNNSTSFRLSGQPTRYFNLTGGSTNAGQLSYAPGGCGKPLDWLPFEEAALHQCALNMQDVSLDTSGANANIPTPNFRLCEFFVNNFCPTRAYRSARQCIIVHAKMHNVAVAATATASSNTFALVPPTSYGSTTSGSLDDLPAAVSQNIITSTHGPTGRKVKNKMKSAAAAAAAAQAAGAVSSQQHGSSGNTMPPNSSSASYVGGDSTAVINRYRGYLSYQYLRSYTVQPVIQSASVNMSLSTASENSTGLVLPQPLNQLFSMFKLTEDNHALLVRKVLRDPLLAGMPQSLFPPAAYRPPGSRRAVLGSTSVTSMSGLYSHHTPGSFTQLPFTAYTHTSTAPALLAHHRHHRQYAGYDHPSVITPTSVSTAESGATVPGSSTPTYQTHSGPIIQKNPAHIAALQENNINPDTLITPAIVIKNKEEREARQRAEALCAVSSHNAASSNSTTTSDRNSFSDMYHVAGPDSGISDEYSSGQGSVRTISCLATGVPTVVASGLSGVSHLSGGAQRSPSIMTIVSSSNTAMLRRSATLTSLGQFSDGASISRIASIQFNHPQSTVGQNIGTFLNTQTVRSTSLQSPSFLLPQQRSQFLTSQALTSARVARTSNSLAATGIYGATVTPIPQILRPRHTIRGSVIQSAFVRTMPATNTCVVPGSATSLSSARLTSSGATSGFMHGRFALSTSSASSSMISNINVGTARSSNIVAGIRPLSTSVFQHVRPGSSSGHMMTHSESRVPISSTPLPQSAVKISGTSSSNTVPHGFDFYPGTTQSVTQSPPVNTSTN